jgi:hypothetical protein
VLLNESTNNLHVSIQGADGSLFVLAHEADVPLYVCTQDGGELTLKLFWVHGAFSLKFYNGNSGDKSFTASWLWMGLNIGVMIRNSSEAFNIDHFWKIFLIKSSRRKYSKGLNLRQVKLTEF